MAIGYGVACPKPVPSALRKEKRDAEKKLNAKTFRDAVWKRDKGRSRATGQPLKKSGTTDWNLLGEVDHAIPRSLAPERIYEVGNGILLSKKENRLRKVPCPRAPEFRLFDYTGNEDRSFPQAFVWRDEDGRIVKQRLG
jgi:hypothetical protein